MKKIFLIVLVMSALQVQGQYTRIQEKNLERFTKREPQVSAELLELSKEYKSHPDFGIIPFQGPPEHNCIELLSKRDAYNRYYIKEGSNASHFFKQQSYSPINYLDAAGNWREINYRLRPDNLVKKLFRADQQPTPFVLNLNDHFASVQFNGVQLKFNKGLRLFHIDSQGTRTSLGDGDWSKYRAGDDGLLIMDFYPGIDVAFTFSTGFMETSFILNHPVQFQDGYLVMQQELEFPDGMKFIDEHSMQHSDLHIGKADRVPVFIIEKCYAYDNSHNAQRQELLTSVERTNNLLVYTSVNWLNDPATKYPVVIDPVVTTSNSLAAATIAGTQFSPVCWTNSCDYFMTVPTPANTTITNIYTSFEYFATGLCFAQDGGFSVDLGTCSYPSAPPGVITCAVPLSNFNCGALNLTTLPDFTSCIPAPQCAPQNLDFTLHFYRCNNDPAVVCGNACIRASQPWTMTIEGRTMEMVHNSPTQIVCAGDSINVVTVTQFGVQPHQFVWSPAAANNDTIRVSPASTTNYTVTVTDACGTTATGSSTVQVTPRNNPGFTVSPNPVCVGQAVTLLGLGSGPVSSYDWTMPGSDAPGGVATNDKSPIIQYAIAGVYPITLKYTSNSCVFDSTLNITVNAVTPASVGMSSSPAGAICPGDTMRFLATSTNGGSAPFYDWYIDGILVQSGAVDSMKSNAFINGSLVQVVMTSNSACSNPTVDTASLFVVFSAAVSPSVSVGPDTSICPGSPVTFVANPSNGGAAPAYQWTINGVAVPGATMNSFTSNINSTDSIVGVSMLSSLSCVSSSGANDSVRVNFEPRITPTVTLSPSPSGAVCPGDPVNFTAQTNGGGPAPTYQWYVNGVASGGAGSDSTFLRANPMPGDSISVRLTSSHNCLLSNISSSWSIITVTAAASPSVSLTASPSSIVCENDLVSITASATAAGSVPVYHWYLNNVLLSNSDSVFNSSTLSDQDVIRVEVFSSLTCAITPSDSDSIIISVSPVSNPAVSIVNTGNGTCVGDTVHWIANPVNGGTMPVYQWTVNGIDQGNNSDSFSYMPQDGDEIMVSLSSNSPCALVPTANSNILRVNLLPYVTPTVRITADPSDTICEGQQVSITSQIQHGGSAPQYSWTVNGQVIDSTSLALTGYNFNDHDIIQMHLISNAPCVTMADTSSNFIRILNYLPLTVSVNGIGNECPGTPVMLTATGGGGDGGPYTFHWSPGGEINDTVIVQPKQSQVYTVEVKDHCGTTSGYGSLTLPVLPGPTSAMTYSPDEVSTLNNIVSFQNLSANAVSWEWDFGDSSTSVLLDPIHTYDSAGNYVVQLTTVSSNGCTDTLRYIIIVKEDIAVFIPSAFSPNGDFFNETWQPIGVSLIDYEYTIYDRWGQIIFTGDENTAWTGHVKPGHTPAQNGVYIYRVDLKEEKFGEKIVVGRVTLIR